MKQFFFSLIIILSLFFKSAVGGPGFVNHYSQTFPYEERAELFALLLLEREAIMLEMPTTMYLKRSYAP